MRARSNGRSAVLTTMRVFARKHAFFKFKPSVQHNAARALSKAPLKRVNAKEGAD